MASHALTVVIPCYNGAATIEQQLEALANQEWSEPWELVVVDNGSTDATPSILHRWQKRLPWLRIVDASEKRSEAYARNQGVRAAKADRIAFCDVDDEVEPGWVAAMGEALWRHDFVAAVIALDKLNPPEVRQRWIDPPRDRLPVCYDFLPAASGCGLGITRRLFERIGPFDETLARLTDIDFSWRAQLSGTPIHLVTDAVVQYRYRSDLRAMFRASYGDGIGMARLYRKFGRVGMPKRRLKDLAASLLGSVRSVGMLRDKVRRGTWLIGLAETLGYLRGYYLTRYRISPYQGPITGVPGLSL